MITFYDNRFVKFSYDKEKDILKQKWTYTHDRNHLYFFQSTNQFLHIIAQYQASKIIIDFEYFTYCLDAASQKWIKKNVFPKFKHSQVKKIAIIKSKDLTSQISLQHLFENSIELSAKVAFFRESKAAIQWLLTPLPITTMKCRTGKLTTRT